MKVETLKVGMAEAGEAVAAPPPVVVGDGCGAGAAPGPQALASMATAAVSAVIRMAMVRM
jgi:hypothetical protein